MSARKGISLDLQGVRERVLRIGKVVPMVGDVRGARTASSWLEAYADFFKILVTFDFFSLTIISKIKYKYDILHTHLPKFDSSS